MGEGAARRYNVVMATESTAASTDTPPLEARVEAALMTLDRPITAGKLAEALQCDEAKTIDQAVASLNGQYEKTGRSFRVEKVAGGYRIFTLPSYKPFLQALHRTRIETRLSPAAMETLAIIAYKQPILRTEIEAIRGVACGEMIRSLMDKHLVRIAGRADEIGRPMLYGTTKQFLEIFGLGSLKDLPQAEELNKP